MQLSATLISHTSPSWIGQLSSRQGPCDWWYRFRSSSRIPTNLPVTGRNLQTPGGNYKTIVWTGSSKVGGFPGLSPPHPTHIADLSELKADARWDRDDRSFWGLNVILAGDKIQNLRNCSYSCAGARKSRYYMRVYIYNSNTHHFHPSNP